MSKYTSKTTIQEVHVTEKTTQENVYRYEYKHSEGGWWITREHHCVHGPFPERTEMWIPDEVMDHMTAYNAKDKLS